ncbi:uncharacterized protein LOC110694866 isoform X2 [Chenopodium quinoa]|uniref:Uncharacterized protein n=1 Tax=Chenopodium quinoa TaxID=63459 RepID=A0A803N4Q4_CHEQI|nr:uncharacterized protein LOC110694866 isoform X2 [Chenopodium quinoa]
MSLQSFLGVLSKVSEFSRAFEVMKKERDSLSDKFKAASEALKSEQTKYKDYRVEFDETKGTLKSAANESLDMASYYFGKARLEMIEEYQQDKHEAWDYATEKVAFAMSFPDGVVAPGSLLLSYANEEVNSPAKTTT